MKMLACITVERSVLCGSLVGEVFSAFRALFEDFIYSRINGWRRNRRSARSLLPAVRAVAEVFNAVGCGAFCERFQSGWRLSSRKRRCPKNFGGALWPFRKEIEVITSPKTGSARQACFESPQSMKRDFQAFKNRTAVTKENVPGSAKIAPQ